MANDVEKTIAILFNATDSTGDAIKSVSSKLSGLSSSVEGMTAPMAQAHDMILKVEAALGALAIGGLALAVNAAGQFGDQFNEIYTIIDGSDAEISKFKDDIKLYAQDSGQALENINSSLYNAISAGVDYKLSVDSLAQSEKLSVAGKSNLDSTLLSLVGTLNAYGASTDEAEKYSDILFTTVERGITTIPELSTNLSKVTGIAAGAGVPFETLAAALATVTSKGVPTSEAITGIKAVLSNIIKPSKDAADTAEALGISFGASALEAKGLEGVLQEVYTATDGNVETMAKFFGSTEALNTALAAVGSDGGAKFLDNLQAMRDSSGATERAYEKMADNFAITNQKMVNNAQLTFIALGENVLESYGDMAGGIVEIFKALQGSIKEGAFDDVFNVVRDLASKLTDEFYAIAENLPGALDAVDFSGFARAVADLSDEAGKLIENIFGADLSTADGLTKAIQRVVDVITILTDVTTGIIEGWQDWAVWLEKVIDSLDDTNGETAKSAGNMLQLGKVINELAGVVGGLAGALGGLGNFLNVLAAKNMVQLITSMTSASTATGLFQKAASNLAGKAGLLGLAASVGYAVGTLLREWFPAIDKAAQKTLGFVDSMLGLSSATEAQEKAQKTLADAVQKYIDNMDAYPDQLTDLREQLQGLGKDVDGLPREVVLQMALDEGLVTPERLLQIAKSAKDLVAGADPVEIPVEFDESQYQLDMADAIDSAKVAAQEAEVVIEPEVKPKVELKDFKEAWGLMEAQVKGVYDVIQSKVEWEAKLEIAELEANAQKVEAIMESVGLSAEGAADVLSSIFSNIGELSEVFDHWTLQGWIEDQIEIQREALEIQKRLAEKEEQLMDARIKRLEGDGALFSIEAEGLQPHMEGFLWELLKVIQARVSEEGLDMLLGTT